MLLGEVKPDSGSFDIGETVVFGYYSQDGLTFDEQIKVIDVVRDIAEEVHLGNGKKCRLRSFCSIFCSRPKRSTTMCISLVEAKNVVCTCVQC